MPPIKWSFELFPAKTAAQSVDFWRSVGQLEGLKPEYFSLTRGAVQASALNDSLLFELKNNLNAPTAAHITTRGACKNELRELLARWHDNGLRKLVVLRGDGVAGEGELDSALQLVRLARDVADFQCSVAGYPDTHPLAASPEADMLALQQKVDAGAHEVLTQFCYDVDSLLRWRDRCAKQGIKAALVPGILPISDYFKLLKFAARCGASIPTHYASLFEGLEGNRAVQQQLGIDLAIELCQKLYKEGFERLHLYTLNIPGFNIEFIKRLDARLGSAAALKIAC